MQATMELEIPAFQPRDEYKRDDIIADFKLIAQIATKIWGPHDMGFTTLVCAKIFEKISKQVSKNILLADGKDAQELNKHRKAFHDVAERLLKTPPDQNYSTNDLGILDCNRALYSYSAWHRVCQSAL